MSLRRHGVAAHWGVSVSHALLTSTLALTVGDQVAVLIGKHGEGRQRDHNDRIHQLQHCMDACRAQLAD
jgi:membrane protein DedA with SNARE-associated domain